LQKLLKEKSTVDKQHNDAISSLEQEHTTQADKMQASIETLRAANDRLQQQLSEQQQQAEKVEVAARKMQGQLLEIES